MGNRTTQRVVCPSCGELLRPTPELLLGLDGIACKCGFRATDRMPGAQHPKAGPSRPLGVALTAAGGAVEAGGVLLIAFGGMAAGALVLAAGMALTLRGAWLVVRARRYAQSAALLGDMVIRRTLVDGVRRIYREHGNRAARVAESWLRQQGISSSPFRRDLMRDARGQLAAADGTRPPA